jgi:hypothetical protein
VRRNPQAWTGYVTIVNCIAQCDIRVTAGTDITCRRKTRV